MSGGTLADSDRPPEVKGRPKSSTFEPEGAGLGVRPEAKSSQVFGTATRFKPVSQNPCQRLPQSPML